MGHYFGLNVKIKNFGFEGNFPCYSKWYFTLYDNIFITFDTIICQTFSKLVLKFIKKLSKLYPKFTGTAIKIFFIYILIEFNTRSLFSIKFNNH